MADTFTINPEPVEKEADIIIDGFTEEDTEPKEVHPLEEGYEHPEDIVPPTIPVEEVNTTLKKSTESKVNPTKTVKPKAPIEPTKTAEPIKQAADDKSTTDKNLDKEAVKPAKDIEIK